MVRQQWRMPVEWRADFSLYQRALALQLGALLSCVVLVLLPAFAILDVSLVDYPDGELVRKNSLLRLPAAILAVVFLVLYRTNPQGRWAYPLLLMLNLSVVGMMAAMFALHYSERSGQLLYISQGLTMTIIAIATVTVYGLRDLVIIYGLPLVIAVAFLATLGHGLPDNPSHLIYTPAAMGIGAIIATMLHLQRRRTFTARQTLEHSALTDALTGLPNRRAMQSQLQAELSRAEREGQCFAVLMADLDRFKVVNDRYGHEVGDEVLTTLASRLTATLRGADRVARWGGEEFLLLIPAATRDSALTVAEKVRQAVAEPAFSTSAGELAVTVSLGVALHQRGESIDQAINRADVALYRAKHEGRNRSVLAEDGQQHRVESKTAVSH